MKGLVKLGKIKINLQPTIMRTGQKALNKIDKAILSNDNSVVMRLIESYVPGGNYVKQASKIVSKLIQSNMLAEAGNILEKANKGEYKSNPGMIIKDLNDLLKKGPKVVGETKEDIKKIVNEVKDSIKKEPIKSISSKKTIKDKSSINDFELRNTIQDEDDIEEIFGKRIN